jgi:hypothetical protein
MLQRFRIIGLALLIAVSTTVASAATILTGGSEQGVGTTNGFSSNFTQGYRFTVNSTQQLTSLGFWDSASDGLGATYQVALWSDTVTPTLLASVSINNSDALSGGVVAGGQWRYETLGSAVTLVTGTTYTIGFFNGGSAISAADSLYLQYSSLSSSSAVSIVNEHYIHNGSPLTFPSSTVGVVIISSGKSTLRSFQNPALQLSYLWPHSAL